MQAQLQGGLHVALINAICGETHLFCGLLGLLLCTPTVYASWYLFLKGVMGC